MEQTNVMRASTVAIISAAAIIIVVATFAARGPELQQAQPTSSAPQTTEHQTVSTDTGDVPVSHSGAADPRRSAKVPSFDPSFSVSNLVDEARKGDPEAQRNVARFVGDCRDLQRQMKTYDSLPESEKEKFPEVVRRTWSNCQALPEEFSSARSRLILEAARKGDKFALVNARFYPPNVDNDQATKEEIAQWQSEVMNLMENRKSDPDVACALAGLYQNGTFGSADLQKALDLFTQIVREFPSNSNCVGIAKRSIETINRMSENEKLGYGKSKP